MKRSLLWLLPVTLILGALAVAAPPEEDRFDDPDVQDLIYFGEARPVLIRLRIHSDGQPFRKVWDRFVGDVFAKLDADKDGVLNRAETAQLPPPGLLVAGNVGEFVRPTLPLRPADLAEFFRRNGAVPFD